MGAFGYSQVHCADGQVTAFFRLRDNAASYTVTEETLAWDNSTQWWSVTKSTFVQHESLESGEKACTDQNDSPIPCRTVD